MKEQSKFSTGQHQEQAAAQQSTAANSGALEFETAEELLRHDASQIVVPPDIARRLNKSIAESAPRRPWWRKWNG
jgi:hypothetical protein